MRSTAAQVEQVREVLTSEGAPVKRRPAGFAVTARFLRTLRRRTDASRATRARKPGTR